MIAEQQPSAVIEEEGDLFAGLSFPTVPTTSIILPKLQDDNVVSISYPTALELTSLKMGNKQEADHEDLETTSLLQSELTVTLQENSVEAKKKTGNLATLYATEVCLASQNFFNHAAQS